MKKKATPINRKDVFQAVVDINHNLTPFHDSTLEGLKAQVEKAVGKCDYRPDPNNQDITFIYNPTAASASYGPGGSALPLGWLGSTSIPAYLGADEIVRQSDSFPSAPDGTSDDDVDSMLGDPDGELEAV